MASSATAHHQILSLQGRLSSVHIEYQEGHMPVWRHYGALLRNTAGLDAWASTAFRALPPGSMDQLLGAPVFPGFGHAEPHQAALRAHRDGADGIQAWVAQGYTQHADVQSQSLTLHLRESAPPPGGGLQVHISLTLFEASDVLRLSTRVTNTGDSLLQIDALAVAAVQMPANLTEVAYFSGQWAHEFQWQRHAVSHSGWTLHNQHGRSSHEAPPACFLLGENTDDHSGPAVAAHLAWSGNHHWLVDRHDDGSLMLQAGEWLAPGELRLAPGASTTTPDLLLTWSSHGLNGVSRNLHAYARNHVLQWHGGAMRPRPVHLNTWEAVYFDHSLPVLQDLATQAAAVGVERFVLDDGWFPGRPNDRSGLGDWWPDPAKYPQGLGPLVRHVQSLGMEFGLWVEPEMVNPDSTLFREHPDWALQGRGRELTLGRNQLVLNIARSEVSDYLFEKLDCLLHDNAIAYLKWDMNRDLAQAQDASGRLVYGQQVHALYALLARLRAAHPEVEIESCASGGGRMDLGVLRHTQRFWTSDNNDAVSRVAIQSGASRLFPPEVLGAHVGPAPAHSTGRSQSMGFRCAVALFGHMGVETDVRHISEADRITLTRWINHYKQWRHLLHTGQWAQGLTANGRWWMVQSETQCIVGVFTTDAPDFNHHAPLALPELPGDALWQVRLLEQVGQARARHSSIALGLDALRARGIAQSAQELRLVGLPIPNMNPESALVYVLDAFPDPTAASRLSSTQQ